MNQGDLRAWPTEPSLSHAFERRSGLHVQEWKAGELCFNTVPPLSELDPFPLSPHTHKVYTHVKDVVYVIMPLLKIKYPQPGVNSPPSSFLIPLANFCIPLRAQVKSLTSLIPTDSACFGFTLLLCSCPFWSYSASVSQPAIPELSGLLWALFVLSLLFSYSPASFSSPSSPSWVSAMLMFPLPSSSCCLPSRGPISNPSPGSCPRLHRWGWTVESSWHGIWGRNHLGSNSGSTTPWL